ncbi:MAG: hypothetical protein HOO67_07220 [Candidatus Peribacteraceae bacterium]|nr:hypothetical protein [Candidatus Peribacteraceae bacterium]
MRIRTTTAVTIASALLLLPACGRKAAENAMEQQIRQETGGDADVDMNADGSMQVTTKDGTYNAGNNQLPEDWPTDAPIYAGAKIQFSGSANGTTGKPGSAAVLTTSDSAADVVTYYKAELAKQGWTISSTMEAQGTSIFGATKGTRALSLLIGSAEGQTSITIGIGEQ